MDQDRIGLDRSRSDRIWLGPVGSDRIRLDGIRSGRVGSDRVSGRVGTDRIGLEICDRRSETGDRRSVWIGLCWVGPIRSYGQIGLGVGLR